MRRIAFLVAVVATMCAGWVMSASAGAVLFPQCPAVDLNTGCQFLVNVSDSESAIETDSTQGPYEGSDDALIGVVNNSSKPISSIPFSAENELFGFEKDGICGVEKPAPGCVVTPKDTTGTANPNAGKGCPPEVGSCAFPVPAGEPAGLTIPTGVEQIGEAENGDPIYGYEGPTSWFSGIGNVKASFGGEITAGKGVVNFSPAIPPGGNSYFSLESPPAGGFGSISNLATTLSGGGQAGASISVPQGTPVTDSATLSAENATTATGAVTFSVYSDSECKTLATAAGSAKLANGTAGPSSAVNLAPGKYYWQAHYNGNTEHQGATSTCGSEIQTVTVPTTTTTAQTGAGVTGANLTVPGGTSVTDKASIAGAQAKTASGTMTYTLFKDKKCTTALTSSSVAVLGGVASPSVAVKEKTGTYYWVASYSGDTLNGPSASKCGSEVLVVATHANLGLPSTKLCLSRRKFIAHPKAPRGVTLVHVEVLINGKLKSQGAISKRRATINLVGLPKGTFKVSMVATASNGKKYVDIRTFHTCVPKKHKK